MVEKACNLLIQLPIASLNPICPLPHASFLTYEIRVHRLSHAHGTTRPP